MGSKWSGFPPAWVQPRLLNADEERKDRDGDGEVDTGVDVDEGLLHVLNLGDEDRPGWNRGERGFGGWEGEDEVGREKKRRLRMMLEIGALFGVGAVLVGLAVLCVGAGAMMRGAIGMGRLPPPAAVR